MLYARAKTNSKDEQLFPVDVAPFIAQEFSSDRYMRLTATGDVAVNDTASNETKQT